MGIDLVEVDRIRRAVRRTPGFVARVYTAGERARADGARDPAERLAARWAAKEAVLKALGAGLGAARFTDIEVATDASGAPHLLLHATAASLAEERGIGAWLVSMTHTSQLAQAIVVGLHSSDEG